MIKQDFKIDLLDLFAYMKKKLFIIVLAGIVCGGAAGLVKKVVEKPKYVSKAVLYVNVPSYSYKSMSPDRASELIQDYVNVYKLKVVMNNVIDKCDLNMKPDILTKQIDVSIIENTDPQTQGTTDTRLFEVKVTDNDPKTAKKIADTTILSANQIITGQLKKDTPIMMDSPNLPKEPEKIGIKKFVLKVGIVGMCGITFLYFLLYIAKLVKEQSNKNE